MKHILLAISVIILGSGTAFAEDEVFECMDASVFKAFYAAGGVQSLPAFNEPPSGGTRVQKQHPYTHLFGQSKFLEGDRGDVAICQYSNHVGLVAQYGQLVKERLDTKSDDIFWRNEWMDSDPKSENVIAVCMERRNDEVYPSTACAFEE